MDSATIEVTGPETILTGPGTVRAETQITFAWWQTVNPTDYVGIVSIGADEG